MYSFDYEEKYAEDEEYTEMGPMARVWNMFLDECNRLDLNMVDDWRDGLDVLLVFVSSVYPSCQNLYPRVI